MTIISRGVEISIAGGGEEMVLAHPLVVVFFSFFFVILRSLFLCTKSLMHR